MDTTSSNSTPAVGQCINSWMELSKSDYAKVIFYDLYHYPDSIGCRFQITDNVHEDPCDYVGLYRVGYDNLDQCIAFKMLSQTECEEDGKMLRCVFKNEELPNSLDDRFYQFLYVTRDKEVCGASTPFEIKQKKEESSDEDIVADRTEDDFLVVRSTLGERHRNLVLLANKYRLRTQQLLDELEEKKKIYERTCDEKEELQQQLLSLRRHLLTSEIEMKKTRDKLKNVTKQLEAESTERSVLLNNYNKLLEENKQLSLQVKEKEVISVYEVAQKHQEKLILEEQLEDAKVMIKALEESKLLALNELNSATKLYTETKKDLEELMAANIELKLKLEEEQSEIQKCKKDYQEMKFANIALNFKLDDEQSEIQKLSKEISVLQGQRRDLKKTVEEKNILIQMQNEEIAKLECSVKDLKKHLEEKSSLLKKPVTLRIRQQPGLKVTSAKDVRKHLVTWNLSKLNTEKLRLRKMKEEATSAEYKRPELTVDHEFARIRQLLAENGNDSHYDVLKANVGNKIKEIKKALVKMETNEESVATSSGSSEGKERQNVDKNLSEGTNAFNDDMAEEKILTIDNEPIVDATDKAQSENTEDKEDKILVQERMIEELKINLVNLLETRSDKNPESEYDPLSNEDGVRLVELFTENCNYKVQVQVLKEKLEDKTKEMEKMSYQLNILDSKCMQWDDEVNDLKAHCAELRSDLEEKDNTICKLKEDCLKKDAVIEYLQKEKSNILKAEAALRLAHDDATSRIKEAADLYKKQYIEIAKLKKKLKRSRHIFREDGGSSKDSLSTEGDFPIKSECNTEKSKAIDDDMKLPSSNVSDSDTGEHVVEPVKQIASEGRSDYFVYFHRADLQMNPSIMCEEEKESPSTKQSGEVNLKMQEMIEQNLAGLSSSKGDCIEDFLHPSAEKSTMEDISANKEKKELPDLQKRIEKDVLSLLTSDTEEREKTDKERNAVSCSICQEPINVYVNNANALIVHLEMEHKQEMCPVCGRLFDMNLPKKYFIYHVENHFSDND